MIVLVSGATSTLEQVLPHPRLGVLLTPDICRPSNIALTKRGAWAADNSAFANFDAPNFCRFLSVIANMDGCMWVTAPDVVADASKTLDRFNRWQPVIAELGLPVAFVAQDGCEDLDLPWGRMRCLFVGGSTEWKESRTAADIVQEAKRRGRWVHVGRVNTKRRVEIVFEWGVDSIDGSAFGRWPATNIPKLLRWLDSQPVQVEATSGDPRQIKMFGD